MRYAKQSTAYNIKVFMCDYSGSGLTSLTLTITAAKGGASSFSSISPTVTEVGNGWYQLALTTSHTDTLGELALYITASGAAPTTTVLVIGPVPANACQINDSATAAATLAAFWAAQAYSQAQAGASTTITLVSGANANNDFYNDMAIALISGTGAGQVRKISDYNGSSKVATVDTAWATNPDNTTTYIILGRIE